MNKMSTMLFVTAFIAVVVIACTKGYDSKKTAGDLGIVLSASSYPLIKGDNSLTINVADAAGKAVTDAKVDVRYYMPAMPGMAPMDYRVQPVLKGNDYTFGANIPMEGGWKVDVAVTRPGKQAVTATFNVDAR